MKALDKSYYKEAEEAVVRYLIAVLVNLIAVVLIEDWVWRTVGCLALIFCVCMAVRSAYVAGRDKNRVWTVQLLREAAEEYDKTKK